MNPTPDLRAVALLSLVVVACVAPAIDNTDPTKATLYCSVTFSGAIAGKYDCHVELSQIEGGQWELRLNTVGDAPTFDAQARWASAPALSITYSLQTPPTLASALAETHQSSDPAAVWQSGEQVTDSLSAFLTAHYASNSGGPCGSFSATLEPKSGSTASGQVQVAATF
jgi:hypothetical protein